jgi:hypothetical protein
VNRIVLRTHNFDRNNLLLRTTLNLAGVKCCVATNSDEIVSSVSRWACDARESKQPQIEMDVVVDLSRSRSQPSKAHFRGLGHLVFALFGEEEMFTFDLLRGKIFGMISPDTAGDQSFWNAQLLPIVVGVMGTTVGVVPLHSACLDRDGKGLLIAGASGAGKSTLAVALAQREFSLVSDDWTYVSNGDTETGLVAAGLSVPVKLLPDAVRHFPELHSFAPGRSLNGEIAFEVEAASTFRSSVKQSSKPHWVMFLNRDERPGCDFIPCDSNEALRFYERSAELLPSELPDAARKRSQIIREVANRRCFRVRSGETPQKTAAAIEEFCERF